MNLSSCRHTGRNNDNKITFPKQHCWNPMTEVATIAADVGGKRILCRISRKDLQKKFNTSNKDSMQIVKKNLIYIETEARSLIEREKFESDGSILITFND